MTIFLLNRKITIQKNVVVTDRIGNHKNTWEDYYTCHATVSGEAGIESENAGLTIDHTKANFTLRWCSEIEVLNNTEYRIVMNDEVFNIKSVDHMNYKKKFLKIISEKERA